MSLKTQVGIVSQILDCEEVVGDPWVQRDTRNNKKSIKGNIALLKEIHAIHSVEAVLFARLWEATDFSETSEEFTRRNFEGRTRYIYCDGAVHIETLKSGQYLHGYICNCEE